MITRRGFLKALVGLAAASALPTITAEVSNIQEAAPTGKTAELVADGAWHYIAFTVSDGKLTLLFDGEQVDCIQGCSLARRGDQVYLRVGKVNLDLRVCTSRAGRDFTLAAWVKGGGSGYVSDVTLLKES